MILFYPKHQASSSQFDQRGFFSQHCSFFFLEFKRIKGLFFCKICFSRGGGAGSENLSTTTCRLRIYFIWIYFHYLENNVLFYLIFIIWIFLRVFEIYQNTKKTRSLSEFLNRESLIIYWQKKRILYRY